MADAAAGAAAADRAAADAAAAGVCFSLAENDKHAGTDAAADAARACRAPVANGDTAKPDLEARAMANPRYVASAEWAHWIYSAYPHRAETRGSAHARAPAVRRSVDAEQPVYAIDADAERLDTVQPASATLTHAGRSVPLQKVQGTEETEEA